jgi:glycolate oxidase FAD binding subunit
MPRGWGGGGGHATLIRRTDRSTLPTFHPEPGPVAALTAGLRRKFDPRGILNPGLMGAGARG